MEQHTIINNYNRDELKKDDIIIKISEDTIFETVINSSTIKQIKNTGNFNLKTEKYKILKIRKSKKYGLRVDVLNINLGYGCTITNFEPKKCFYSFGGQY